MTASSLDPVKVSTPDSGVMCRGRCTHGLRDGYWLAWCKSEYTMRHCVELRDRLRAEGYRVRVDSKGTHMAGDGTMQPFGKVFVWEVRE